MRPTRSRLPVWLAAGVALAVAAGCAAPGVKRDDLDERPIAMLHWTHEEARKRNELLEEVGAVPEVAKRGVATPETLGVLLGAAKVDARDVSRRLNRWPGHVVLLDPRTGEITRVEAAPPGARPLAWSEDHRRLLFSTNRISGKTQIYEYDLDSGEVRSLTYGDEAHPLGDIGPDGQLLYTGIRRAGRGLRSRVYLAQAHEPRGQIVMEGELHEAALLSPRGDVALLVRADLEKAARPGTEAASLLVIRQLDGSGKETVIGRGKEPRFTPDGDFVVYSAPIRGGGWRLAKVRAEGLGRRPLGEGPRDERMPAISPDGLHVVFVAPESDFDRLYMRRMDGTGTRVLFDDGSVAWPVW